MHYKTITLGILEQHPEFHHQLRSNRMLLTAVELLAKQLKTRHEMWIDRLSKTRPSAEEPQITSEALEFALKEMADLLAPNSSPRQMGSLSLDGAMAFIRGQTQTA